MPELTKEASDPNTAADRLRELFVRQSDAVLRNPALPLILLENPNWVYKLEVDTLGKVLQNRELPEFFVRGLTRHPMAYIARVAGMHVALGEEVECWEPLLQNLAALGCSSTVRQTLDEYELVPVWLRPYLTAMKPGKNSPAQATRISREQMVETLISEVRKHPGFFAWFCCLLLTRDEKRLASAARSGSWFTRFGVALHESSKPGALKRLEDDSNRYVRFAARARLRDTAWVFPPAMGGGQGEKS